MKKLTVEQAENILLNSNDIAELKEAYYISRSNAKAAYDVDNEMAGYVWDCIHFEIKKKLDSMDV